MTIPQPPLRTDFLWPQQLTTPQVPQNLLRPSWKGYGTLGGCSSSNCGCTSCGGPNVPTTALAGFGAKQLGRATLGAYSLETITTQVPSWLLTVYGLASLAGGAAGAYHGYRRHDSVWAGVGWFFLGSWFWPISIPIAFAQGFAKRK